MHPGLRPRFVLLRKSAKNSGKVLALVPNQYAEGIGALRRIMAMF
jgi:hypothetical protein